MFKISKLCMKLPQKTSLVQLSQYLRKYSSVSISAIPKAQSGLSDSGSSESTSTKVRTSNEKIASKNPMVAAVFAALNSGPVEDNIKTPRTDERIRSAETLEELLNLSEGSGVSRKFALKIVSVLADWCSADKIKMQEFDTDPRFIRLCKILTKKQKTSFRSENDDLSLVINITADDEAARLINGLTIAQMVRVVGMLVAKNRRSVSLLHSISYNISRSHDRLDLKYCADLLYGMACLNYFDDILLEKICLDISPQLKNNTKGSAVVGSILTSLGIIRYKDEVVLDALSQWIFANPQISRLQDIFSLFLTLAITNHQPENSENVYKTLLPLLSLKIATKSAIWLNHVWSLIVLNQATEEHIESVLSSSFIQKLEKEQELQISHTLKLLNVNAAATELLTNEYKGPKLDQNSKMHGVTSLPSKSKKVLVLSVVETLSNIFPLETYLKTNVNTKLGFCIDAECLINNKGEPVPLNKSDNSTNKVAVMVYDFHDMCRGKIEPTGMYVLFERLMRALGYKVLAVPYTEYNPKDKLVQRVKFLKNKLNVIS